MDGEDFIVKVKLFYNIYGIEVPLSGDNYVPRVRSIWFYYTPKNDHFRRHLNLFVGFH
jgi:hypothetical protein